jgi:hypothetical protein
MMRFSILEKFRTYMNTAPFWKQFIFHFVMYFGLTMLLIYLFPRFRGRRSFGEAAEGWFYSALLFTGIMGFWEWAKNRK